MTKHTPGPWHVGKEQICNGFMMPVIQNRCGVGIAYVCKDEANIIAAAPELLAALCELMNSIENIDEAKSTATDDALTVLEGRLEKASVSARVAIAKAKGDA